MSILRKLLFGASVCLLSATLATQACVAQQDRNTVVADIDGHKMTFGEIEERNSAELLDMAYNLYVSQRKALDTAIDDFVLAQEARRHNLSAEQFLEKYVDHQVSDPTEENLRILWEASQTDEPFEAMRDKVAAHLRKLRTQKARALFVRSLREKANITILLAPPVVNVAVGNAPTRGPQNAPITLIEYADYQCPYCQQVHPEVQKLLAEFGDQITFAFKDFPLPNHPEAGKAAEAAHCAGDQGKFWEYHDVLFQNTKKLAEPHLAEYAKGVKLDVPRFKQCLDSGRYTQTVKASFEEGRKLGLSGTPSFVMNGRFFSGAVTYNMLRDFLKQALVERKAAKASPRAAEFGYEPVEAKTVTR